MTKPIVFGYLFCILAAAACLVGAYITGPNRWGAPLFAGGMGFGLLACPLGHAFWREFWDEFFEWRGRRSAAKEDGK